MKYCSACGAQIRDDATYCPNCGANCIPSDEGTTVLNDENGNYYGTDVLKEDNTPEAWDNKPDDFYESGTDVLDDFSYQPPVNPDEPTQPIQQDEFVNNGNIPQQPGTQPYTPQGYQQPPVQPKKSKAPLIIGIVCGVIALFVILGIVGIIVLHNVAQNRMIDAGEALSVYDDSGYEDGDGGDVLTEYYETEVISTSCDGYVAESYIYDDGYAITSPDGYNVDFNGLCLDTDFEYQLSDYSYGAYITLYDENGNDVSEYVVENEIIPTEDDYSQWSFIAKLSDDMPAGQYNAYIEYETYDEDGNFVDGVEISVDFTKGN